MNGSAKDYYLEVNDFDSTFLQFQAVMDRDLSHQFPQMQIDFIDTICGPVYQASGKITKRTR